jgi:O-antigen/teichoic acid export membrane protein
VTTTPTWHQPREHAFVTLARNVSTRYVLIVVNVIIGLVMLRYNVQHLGQDTYGLLMLATSVTAYFTVLDFGYGSAVVRYVAEFRARRDVKALNETLSTMAFVFLGVGALCYLLAIGIAVALPYLFNIEPAQVQSGRLVLLICALQVALYFPFSVFGGVINGFERYYVNNVVGLVFNVLTAIVNVIVLAMGYGIVELVACSTFLRIAPLWIYRWNAYRVFPQLEIRRNHFRRERLRELSGFSIYVAVVDWSGRLTYTTDAFFLGVFMNTAAVAVYSVAQRISDTLLTLTHQIQTLLMPAVVHRAIDGETAGQRSMLVRATRFQFAIAMCLCGAIGAAASTLIHAWLGPGWNTSATVTQILAAVVVIRAAIAMPITVLQGTGHHRFVAAASACGAVANLILSLIMVTVWGIIGVALATVLAAILCAVMVFPRSCRAVGIGVWAGCRAMLLPALWPAALTIVCVNSMQRVLPLGVVAALINVTVGMIVYAVVFVLFGLDREERLWFLSVWQRISSRRSQRLATSDVVG